MPAAARPPVGLLVAFCFIVLEAAALAALAIGLIADLITGANAAVGTTLPLAVFYLLLAVGLAVAGRALTRGRRAARGPVVTWQLLQAASAFALAPVFRPWVIAVMVIAAVAVLAGVIWPSSRDFLEGSTARQR